MASENTIQLRAISSENLHAIPGAQRLYTGGTNVFRPLAGKLLHTGFGRLHGSRTLPKTLVNTSAIKAIAVFSLDVAGSTGQKARLAFAYSSLAAGESADPAAAAQTVATSQDIASWTAKTLYEVEFTLTAANLAGEDKLYFWVGREGTHTDDNYNNPIWLEDIRLLATY